ncbi:MAG: type II toxin-antitoxin system HicB family antitoxin [Nitrospira sp.]|nr:type II toxin-antitoxin system HicB family antitoxin [Nitrospira sp.]
MKLLSIIEREGDGYVSRCPQFDIASQGDSIEQARDNLQEALTVFFETASDDEVQHRRREDIFVAFHQESAGCSSKAPVADKAQPRRPEDTFVTQVEVAVG